MPIVVNIDVMMARRKMSAGELAERVGITPANLSILKNNKAKAIRFSHAGGCCGKRWTANRRTFWITRRTDKMEQEKKTAGMPVPAL